MSKTPDFDLHTEYPTSLLNQSLPRPDEDDSGDDISLKSVLVKTNALVAGIANGWGKSQILDALSCLIKETESLLEEGNDDETSDVFNPKAAQCWRIVVLEGGYNFDRSVEEIETAALRLMYLPDAEIQTRVDQLEAHAGCSKCPQMFHAGTKAIWNQVYLCGDCASK